MKKRDAVEIFGTTQSELARAVGVTKQAVSAWPDILPGPTADRVRGAAVRLGLGDKIPQSEVA